MRIVWILAFTVLPLIALVYIGWHIWLLLPLPAWCKAVLIAVGVLCFSLLFLSVARLFDSMPMSLATACYEIGTSSLMILLYAVMLFLVLDLGRLVHLVPDSFLVNSWVGTVSIVAVLFGIFLYGNLHYNHKVKVDLELLSAESFGKEYRIVMASDLHLGYHNQRKEFARWVDLINAQKPDFVLIAGDIIDGSMRPLLDQDMAAEFRRINAPVYACLGNHEYYAGEPRAAQFYKDAGIHLLIDQAEVVDSSIVIIGRDDRTNTERLPLDQLVGQSPKGKYLIVLDHQPFNLEQSESVGADFQFSGHTHRGQVWPISWITDAMYECSWGSHSRGKTQYYVSSGLGIWGGKFRIGSQSEYVVATIK